MKKNPAYWLGLIAGISKQECNGQVNVKTAYGLLMECLYAAKAALRNEKRDQNIFWIARAMSVSRLKSPSKVMKSLRGLVKEFPPFK